MNKLLLSKQTKRLMVMTVMLFLTALPAFSQISYTMTDKHGRLKRQALRDANQAEASTFKDTHLNMEAYTFKKGESGKVNRRPVSRLFRKDDALQRRSADRDKKKFRLFRKKEK